ncbi:MAG TPA: PAS domain S-box protein [Acidisarcina sp.]
MTTSYLRRWRGQVALGSALLTLFAVGTISYRGIVSSRESQAWVDHTRHVLAVLQDLTLAIQTFESSFRGFVITGNQSYIGVYRIQVAHAKQALEEFGRLTEDNSRQQALVPDLKNLFEQKVEFSETILSIRQASGLEAAASTVPMTIDQGLTSGLQNKIDALANEEQRLLALREAETNSRIHHTKVLVLLISCLGLLVAVAADWGAGQDDYRRKRAERTLRNELLESAPDAMVVVNGLGKIVLMNLQAEKQFGYRRTELAGQPISTIIPEGFAERVIADGARTAAAAIAQQIGGGIELCGRRKNGNEFPIEIMLSPLENDREILIIAAIRDISIRKEAQRHLALLEGRYRGLLEAAPDAMVLVNRAGHIVVVNAQAEKQFGYCREELVGQPAAHILPGTAANGLITEVLRSTATAPAQSTGLGVEVCGRHKNGSEFPIEIMLGPLKSTEGVLVTVAIRDITARKQADALLLEKLEELNRSNEELEKFAYIASHDLQEPLRMVASYTQLLSRRYKGKLDAEADEFIAYAVDGALRMQRLIQDLLAYSRIGTQGKELLNTSGEEVFNRALSNLQGAIEDSGAVVTHGPMPTVLGDESQLIQLFQNLIGNGIKYQDKSADIPRIHVSAERSKNKRWVFSVKDNGLGISPQYFERIFGMFQRLHKREEFAGTGIGLAICKKIVERHGGNISVESEPGHGSTFRFALIGE